MGMDQTPTQIAEQVIDLKRLNEGSKRLLAALSAPKRLMPCLRFLEVDFLKPTSKNPRLRKSDGTHP